MARRWRSSASSLLALSAVALALTGCGESTTHSAADVRRAFAAEGIELRSVYPEGDLDAVVPRSERALQYRVGHALETLASRKTHRWLATAEENDELFVIVLMDPYEAEHQLKEPGVDDLRRFGLDYVRKDNVLSSFDIRDRGLVLRALDRL